MDKDFIDILQKLITAQGKKALLDESKCKSLLADYTKGEFKKESRFLLLALEAGVQKAINTTKDLNACKKKQIKLLHDEYSLDEKVATDVVNTLAFLLRGDAGLEAQAAFERGNKHYEIKNYNKAIEEYSEAIRLDPNNAKAYANRGFAYQMKSQYDKAFNDYSEAIRFDQNNAWVYTKRGMIYNYKQWYDKAINDFNEAIRLDPNSAEAYGGRGDAYSRKGLHDKTISDLTKAIELNPNDALNYMSLGQTYLEKGDKKEAIKNFEKVRNMETIEPNKEFAKNMLRKLEVY